MLHKALTLVVLVNFIVITLLLLSLTLISPCLAQTSKRFQIEKGAIIRGDQSSKQLALVFTGDQYADGGKTITRVLKQHRIKASFFFTGRFYRNPAFKSFIQQLKRDGHYLGAHSDEHLLYCDWNNRDQLLVSRSQFEKDLTRNYLAMQSFHVSKTDAHYFLPPYEWYNQTISDWTSGMGLQLINFTHGTRSTADYTTPEMKNYVDSETIMRSIKENEERDSSGLNGFLLLLHVGTAPERTDKFYNHLDELIRWLKMKSYKPVRIDQLLKP